MTFAPLGPAFLFTVFLWWFSTGAILWLNRRSRATYGWSLVLATFVAGAAIYGLAASLNDPSPAGAYCAFTCALGLWGWHEMSFLMGFITGPRAAACPAGARGLRRFKLAAATLIHHEIALVLTAAALIAASWGHANPVGAWTFGVLLVSRLSAKLNLFFGVPNFSEEFFPPHLQHMVSYLRKAPMNPLFPASALAGAVLAAAALKLALDPDASAFQATGAALIFTLGSLALIEHLFMVTPLPDAALWRWLLPAPTDPPEPAPAGLSHPHFAVSKGSAPEKLG